MSITLEELDNISTLARIDITSVEKPKMLADMQAIVEYISEINSVKGSVDTIINSHHNITREDVVTHTTGDTTEVLLSEAPSIENGYVKVEQVFK